MPEALTYGGDRNVNRKFSGKWNARCEALMSQLRRDCLQNGINAHE
jgi:hypothetical protein